MTTLPYSAFEHSEFDIRFVRARQVLRDNGLAAAVIMAPEHLFYFAGYDSWVSVNSPQALVFTGDNDAPTLLLRDVDLPLARETSWVTDIRTYDLVRDDFAALVRGLLDERAVTSGSVAIELISYAVPAALGDALRAALDPVTMVDATRLIGDLRHIKSPAELAFMRQAGAFANLGLHAMVRHATAGLSEIALAAEIEAAMRRAGADYWAIPTELTSGSRSAGGHGTPRSKLIETGDLVHAEFAGVHQRYHATAIQTISVGEPSPRARELYDIGIASLDAGIAAARPGAAVAGVEEASLGPLRAHGLEHAAMMRFGYGVGIAYPPIWLETLQIARGFDFTLQPGMAFVLHSCLELPDENLGVIQGGTWVMTEAGLEPLAGAGSCELMVL
jgi:Xaa-Pro aminopeptidase